MSRSTNQPLPSVPALSPELGAWTSMWTGWEWESPVSEAAVPVVLPAKAGGRTGARAATPTRAATERMRVRRRGEVIFTGCSWLKVAGDW